MSKTDAYLDKLRNTGIIAHIDAGKTTLTERILFYTKKIHRMGEVHEGAATMDFTPEEQEHGITIASACCTCHWGDYSINLIDTPGHVDFSIEVERCLRVLDGVVGVFCAVGGVEPQSETVWRQAEKFGIPKLAFVNKMDRLGASFKSVLEEMRTRLGVSPLALTLPIGEGEEFEALIDLVSLERVDFDAASQGSSYTRSALSEAEAALAAPWREAMMNALADEDDAIMEKYLTGEEMPLELLRSAIRHGTLRRSLVPVFAGSALRNTGVQLLLDGICAYLPNPAEAAPQEAEDTEAVKTAARHIEKVKVTVDPKAPLSALVFKLFMEGGRKLSLVRIYSGELREGLDCLNVTRGKAEKISRIFRLNADSRDQLNEARAGDIVAVQGLRSVCTGDSIAALERRLLLENITAYRPVISIAIEPKNSGEGEKLDEVLQRLQLEDPTLQVELDEASGQRVVSGMGELHLEVLLERLKREYGLIPRAGNPQVVCQETVLKSAEASGEFDRELGEVRHYGQVTLRVAPRERGSGNLVRWAFDSGSQTGQAASGAAQERPSGKSSGGVSGQSSGQSWPAAWLEAVDRGIDDSLQSGVLQGFPLQDVLVEVLSMQRRDGSSSPAGYHMAAVAALKNALAEAKPVLLEPLMHLEISVPDSHLGAALNLISTHGGKVSDLLERGEVKIVKALAPMRELFGFSTYLRSSTQGRAGLIMRFERFDILG
ncbi:MAG: elongation factor G [Deltaproteobacteria bacterium]|jgi:elongation factor G|nr:elongation factor G [Deltaproteobacteria bacterium]